MSNEKGPRTEEAEQERIIKRTDKATEDVPERDDNVKKMSKGGNMSAKVRERRIKTWKMYFVEGVPYGEVTSTLSEEYDVTVHMIRKDIANIDDWLPRLDTYSLEDGTSRLRELRTVRQRVQGLAKEAREDDDREEELKHLKEAMKMIERDIELSQSLGFTPKEPDKAQVEYEHNNEFVKALEEVAEEQDAADGTVETGPALEAVESDADDPHLDGGETDDA